MIEVGGGRERSVREKEGNNVERRRKKRGRRKKINGASETGNEEELGGMEAPK